MIPTTATSGSSHPATVEFLDSLETLAHIDAEAVEVFMEIHNEYRGRKYVARTTIGLEKALASCGMILLIRTFALLQKFVELPRHGTTEAHYHLTLRERDGDGVQVIDIHYQDDTIAEVALERALHGGGIYEDTVLADSEMEDVSHLEYDSDTDTSSAPPSPVQLTGLNLMRSNESLEDLHGHIDWDTRVREGLASWRQAAIAKHVNVASSGPGVRAADGMLLESDEEEVRPLQEVMTFTRRHGASLDSCSKSLVLSDPAPPIIASSSFHSLSGLHRRNSLFDEDPEDTERTPLSGGAEP